MRAGCSGYSQVADRGHGRTAVIRVVRRCGWWGNSTKERTRRISMETARIMQQLRERIINQDEALDQLEEALLIAEAGLNDPRKPLAVPLFVGPTGVGKTETVRALTEAIHGDVEHYCRIDMSGLNESHYSASLAGSPPGYVGSQEDESLLNRALIEGETG